MLAVVGWVLSTARHPPFLRKPYNPVLGETHCVHGRESFLLVEQARDVAGRRGSSCKRRL